MLTDNYKFLRLLAIERKRSERSGTPFTLVQLRIAAPANGSVPAKCVASLERALSSVIRDTDVAGWHDPAKTTVGILFTEIASSAELVTGAILKRIANAIAQEKALRAVNFEVVCQVFLDGARQVETFEAAIVEPSVLMYRGEAAHEF